VETSRALALAVEAKDPYSAGHSKRVGYYAMKIGEVLGLEGYKLMQQHSAIVDALLNVLEGKEQRRAAAFEPSQPQPS
jgi:HD-GYP domain-containing protein (c-di-GMP phosphodiesterase class II)